MSTDWVIDNEEPCVRCKTGTITCWTREFERLGEPNLIQSRFECDHCGFKGEDEYVIPESWYPSVH